MFLFRHFVGPEYDIIRKQFPNEIHLFSVQNDAYDKTVTLIQLENLSDDEFRMSNLGAYFNLKLDGKIYMTNLAGRMPRDEDKPVDFSSEFVWNSYEIKNFIVVDN